MVATIYVAESNRSYGTGTREADAVFNMAANWHGSRPEEDVTMMVASCEGYEGGAMWEVECDTLLSRDVYAVPAEQFNAILDTVEAEERDLVVEDAIVSADELDW